MDNAIAIIGMAGRFPQARTLDRFWENLRTGVESIRPIPDEDLLAAGVPPAHLRDPGYVRATGLLEDVDLFDAPFFGFSAREAALLDPQHRILLEIAWESLEAAGYDAERIDRPVGLYAGASVNSYFLYYLFSREHLYSAEGAQLFMGNDNNFLATRTSYKLGLRGPSLTVQTACSTSLVAVHLGCQSLLNGECDMALAGGVSVRVPQVGYIYRPGGILSPDGHCRAFDAAAGGSVMGSGVGMVVLKRLEDALADRDPIQAVILGSAVNNDGAFRIGYTAPSVEGQSAAIAEALAIAQVEPETVSYVEAHGSGTPLGDPIELAALNRVFGEAGTPGTCAIGSVKSNIGHLDAAAGIAGLIKTVLALEHEEIPPSLHFTTPNPAADFPSSPFAVSARLQKWTANGAPRRAGVSSFGMGGTNAHMVLQEAPRPEPSGASRPWQLLLLSAATPAALDAATDGLAAHLETHPEEPLGLPYLADIAYTLSVGRKVMRHRRALVVRDGGSKGWRSARAGPWPSCSQGSASITRGWGRGSMRASPRSAKPWISAAATWSRFWGGICGGCCIRRVRHIPNRPKAPFGRNPHPLAPSPTRTHTRPGEGEPVNRARQNLGWGRPLSRGTGSAGGRGGRGVRVRAGGSSICEPCWAVPRCRPPSWTVRRSHSRRCLLRSTLWRSSGRSGGSSPRRCSGTASGSTRPPAWPASSLWRMRCVSWPCALRRSSGSRPAPCWRCRCRKRRFSPCSGTSCRWRR